MPVLGQTPTEVHLIDTNTIKWTAGAAYQDPNFPNYQVRDVTADVQIGAVDPRTTTSETINAADYGELVTLSNASPIAVTLDSTAATPYFVFAEVVGAGTATFTPSSGNINGVANLTLSTGQSAVLFFDGANWWAVIGATTGAAGTVTHTGTLTADEPVFGNGGADIKVGTKRGNTTVAQMADNTSNPTTGNLAVFDANGNITDGGTSPGGAGTFPYGGDGSDSTVHFDGIANPVAGATLSGSTYTLTRDVWGTTVTIDNTVTVLTANWRIFATGTFTNNGIVDNSGAIGSVGGNAVSATGAGGGAKGLDGNGSTQGSISVMTVAGQNGTAGGNGTTTAGAVAPVPNNGTQTAFAVIPGGLAGNAGTQGGAGGNGTGGSGGLARAASSGGIAPSSLSVKPGRQPINLLEWGYRNVATPSQWAVYNLFSSTSGGAVGGSGGGGDTTNSGGGGGGGAGAGGSGGTVMIVAASIVNAGTITANGATGGQGGNGFSPAAGNTGGGGAGAGGPGGNGGYVVLLSTAYTNSGTVQAVAGSGGAHGTGGTHHGTGSTDGGNGNDGASGKDGAVIQFLC